MSRPGPASRILVANAGSSSLKLRLLDEHDHLEASVDLDAPSGVVDQDELAGRLYEMGPADAVGHRVVHGGERFRDATVVDDGVLAALDDLVALAPIHQPAGIATIRAVRGVRPELPAVACFDTAFHATLPAAASTYAIPREWRDRFGARRYGFHGLSHAWASRRAAELAGRPLGELSTVTCHLGAGSSLTAVAGGRSVDTTMGFTPLDGLVMATRSGSLDPGLVVWLVRHGGIDAETLDQSLTHRSGLVALAGTPDMRAVIAAAEGGDATAVATLDVYGWRLRASIASMVAALAGLDALVFTGGIGERAPFVRAAAANGLGFLGVGIDEAANRAATPDCEITAPDAAVRTFVIEAREDIEVARQVRAVLSPAS